MKLIYTFWHRNVGELDHYRSSYQHAYMWLQFIGPYEVRTWTNKDGKPICTGWFRRDTNA
jgi:hypothetical protein